MNKTALKNFATWSRRKLIEQVQTKAFLYGIDEKNGLHMEEQFGQLVINGQTYPLSMKSSFTALQKQLEQKGYKQLLEEVAYTWFNRIIAIRYMEVHEYLPEKVNVLSSSVGRVDPDILFEFDTMDLAIDEAKVRELVNAGDTEAAFRILFVTQCNALNTILPFMFEKIQDYTELLLPDFLLDAESVIKTLVQSEELTESFEEIEVIGWLYQYYIAEEKDRVFAQKSKYKKEEIPFATQLFTPKWIVQYMVQNSLGRYWTKAHREDEDLIDKWEYFIKHEEEDFHEKIAPYVNKELKVEDIKLLDPAMGSGHILVYAFEVFHEIYEKCGYPEREIPRLILENNLYGLDIDDRAYQLASFAVVMKAASYSKRFLRSVEREGITLNIASIQETNHISDEVMAYIAQEDGGERYSQVKAFFEQYHNAKTYGSLINITEREISFIEERLEQIVNNPVHDLFYVEQHEIAKQVLPALVQQTKIMRNEYDVVVMNPPYMGNNWMDTNLTKFLNKYYKDSKSDLYSAFMEKSFEKKHLGIKSMITMESWMFLNSFENLRKKLLENNTILNLIHLPYEGKGRTSLGINFGTAVSVFQNKSIENYEGIYQCIRYNEIDQDGVPYKFPTINERYSSFKQENAYAFPNSKIAYWATNEVLNIFLNSQTIGDIAFPRLGMATADNNKFLRLWFECDAETLGFGMQSREEAVQCGKKWFPYNKGGEYRKWYGNAEYVVDWENDGERIKNFKDSNGKIRSHNYNLDFIFKEGITWSALTSGKFSARYSPNGFLFDNAGSSCFANDKNTLDYLLALLSSNVVEYLLPFINPTMNYQPGTIGALPVVLPDKETMEQLSEIVKECIELTKSDWDENEISWEFQKHPLVFEESHSLKDNFDNYTKQKNDDMNKLKINEELINKKIISLYNLQVEILADVKMESLSIEVKSKKELSKGFLSYLIGCIVGRYSCNSNSNTDEENQPSKSSLALIQLTETQYFQNDIIFLISQVLKEIFTEETVADNILWLAEALEMKQGEDAETRIRRYYMDEFFAEHCKMYQKRPIYWLVDSGKQKGLRTLIYMHRYQSDTMATIRFEHLQEIQAKYQQEIADLENRLVNPNLSATDKKKLNSEKVSFEKKIDELREFDKRLAAIAAEEIEIDLDDGVKVNYEKFYRGGKGVLAKIK